MPSLTYRQTPAPTAAVAIPQKPHNQHLPLYTRQPIPTRHNLSSPPASSSLASSSAVPSLTNGGYSTTAGSVATMSNNSNSNSSRNSDYDAHHIGGVDLIEMMTDRLHLAVNPEPLDRSIVKQAQTSGQLNAKQRELAELQEMARRRLKATRSNIREGMSAAREVRRDLEWTQKKVISLNTQASKQYPAAYKTASAKYPRPISP